MKARTISIGNTSGYWGDDPSALRRMLEGPIKLDYIVSDLLAELSLSILQKLSTRGGSGYPEEALSQLIEVLPLLKQRGTVFISNGGGLAPRECARALHHAAEQCGISITIGIVSGDAVTDQIMHLAAKGNSLAHLETGESLHPHLSKVKAAHAYIGALPIARALAHKPDIVLCGRVTDSALTLGPLMHEFDWRIDDYDKLASGVIAGHLIECGTQVTGGNLTDWREVPRFSSLGFPIVSVSENGDFTVHKQPGTGGLVTEKSVTEQLVYEIFVPQAYLTPDVTADVTTLILRTLGKDRVSVSGVRGYPPPPTLKVNVTYEGGYKCSGSIFVSGPDAREKATVFSKLLWQRFNERLKRSGLSPCEATATEFIGDSAAHGPRAPQTEPHEILIRFSARDVSKEKLALLRKEIPALILSGPPGVCATGGAPEVTQIIGYWPTCIARDEVTPTVEIIARGITSYTEGVPFPDLDQNVKTLSKHKAQKNSKKIKGAKQRVPLSTVAYGRSGDKGNTANIGIVARTPALFEYLGSVLTAQVVKKALSPRIKGKVTRYALKNLSAYNFVIENALDGGGTLSMRIDSQGKHLAQGLLTLPIDVPVTLLPLQRGTKAAKKRRKQS
jgi:hypothetical protein